LIKYNYHTHTHFCDGSAAPEEYVLAAIKLGMNSLGFSGHAPVPFENNFAIKNIDSLKAYTKEINELKLKYKGRLDIYLGLEADFIPGTTLDFKNFIQDFGLDYIIGSVHLVKTEENRLWFIDGPRREIWQEGLSNYFHNDIKTAVTAYYRQLNEMIDTQKPDIIGHLDKIKMHNHEEYFSEEEDWYLKCVMETLEVARDRGSIIEINTRGVYKKRSASFFPGGRIIREMKKMNIPVCLNADAHKPAEVGMYLTEASKVLQELGYLEVCVFEDGGWGTTSLT